MQAYIQTNKQTRVCASWKQVHKRTVSKRAYHANRRWCDDVVAYHETGRTCYLQSAGSFDDMQDVKSTYRSEKLRSGESEIFVLFCLFDFVDLATFLPTTYLPTCLPTYLPTYLPTFQPSYLLHLPTYLPTFLPTYRPTYLPSYLHVPTYLPSFLPTYRPTYLPFYLSLCFCGRELWVSQFLFIKQN